MSQVLDLAGPQCNIGGLRSDLRTWEPSPIIPGWASNWPTSMACSMVWHTTGTGLTAGASGKSAGRPRRTSLWPSNWQASLNWVRSCFVRQPVHDHRHLDVPVRDGLTERVLGHDLASRPCPAWQSDRSTRPGSDHESPQRMPWPSPVDVVLVTITNRSSAFSSAVEAYEILVLGAHQNHLVGGADQLLHVEDEHLQPLRVAQLEPALAAWKLSGVTMNGAMSAPAVLADAASKFARVLRWIVEPGVTTDVPDTLLSQVLDQRRHQEGLTDARGESAASLKPVLPSAIR